MLSANPQWNGNNVGRVLRVGASVLLCLLLFPDILFSQRDDALIARDEILPIVAPFDMPQLKRPDIPLRLLSIKDFGAQEGGHVKNTMFIQRAVDSASRAGGGIVVIPEGIWLTGPIRLDNRINLHVLKGAEVIFSQDFEDYLPVVFSRHEDIECYKYSSFIYADGKTDIAITGEGTLHGQGKPWWSFKEAMKASEDSLAAMAERDVPAERRVFDGTNNKALRPAFFQPIRCKNVLVEGVTFVYGAFWTITPTYCENVIIRKTQVITEGPYGHTPNGDGIDPSSCRNVLIEHCVFDTGDDCIAIKAGRDRDGRRVGMPTENVVIRFCSGSRGHGGIVVGSETAAGIRNVYAYDCTFRGTDRMVRIKTARGRGGTVENMWFRNMRGENIEHEAIHLNMLYTGDRFPVQPITDATPRIRNITLDRIFCTAGKSFTIAMIGLPEMPIENIAVDSVDMSGMQGIACTDVREVHIRNASIKAQTSPLIHVIDGEHVTFDSLRHLPAAGKILLVEGPRSNDIRILNSGARKRRSLVTMGADVPRGAVFIGE